MNTYFLRVLFLESLQLLLLSISIQCHSLNLRLKVAYLSLKVRYLLFKCDMLLLNKGKVMTNDRRRPVLIDKFLEGIKWFHALLCVVPPNRVVSRISSLRFEKGPFRGKVDLAACSRA